MQISKSWKIWVRWIVVNIFAFIGLSFVVRELRAVILLLFDDYNPADISFLALLIDGALTSFVFGTLVGVSQYFIVIRQELQAKSWILATAIGVSFSSFIVAVILKFSPPKFIESEFDLLSGGLILFIFRICLRISQWFVLRSYVKNARWWIISNSFILPFIFLIIQGMATIELLDMRNELGAFMVLLFFEASTGAILIWLLQSQKINGNLDDSMLDSGH